MPLRAPRDFNIYQVHFVGSSSTFCRFLNTFFFLVFFTKICYYKYINNMRYLNGKRSSETSQ